MVKDLQPIDLETAPPNIQDMPKKRLSWKPFAVAGGIVVLVLAILAVLLFPLKDVVARARVVVSAGRTLGNAVKGQDLEKTKTGLVDTRKAVVALAGSYKKLNTVKYIPFIGAYIWDGEHAINAIVAGLDAGDKAVEAIEPNADLLGLKGKSKFVAGSADERIQLAVKTMTALIPKINEIAVNVETLRKEIDAINPERYPVSIGKTEIRPRLIGMKDTIDNAANLFVNAQPLLKNLPSILGSPDEKRYLVIFQNDKELRPTGGFMTAFARFRFIQGKAILEMSEDIYSLDAALTRKYPAPQEILDYLPGVYNLNIRDSNLSPDFKKSMQQFESMYAYTSGREKIDGIIAMDTHVLVEALRILGPITIGGRVYSADIDKRCDCARAIYELEDYSTRPVNYIRTQRKDEIGILLRTILQMALGVSPSKYWGNLFQMLITEINEKHVQTYFRDTDIQKAAESFNMAGRIMTATESAAVLKYQEGKGWDYLHVNQANMGGAKSNMFVTEKITKETTVNSDGTLKTKLTIDYNNPYPGSDCGLESGGLCLNAPLRNWLRVYVPAGSKLVESRGTQSPKAKKAETMSTFDDLGKTVFQGFLVVDPKSTARVEITYTSPVKSADGSYRLLIQRQSGSDDQQYILKLNGKTRVEEKLLTDKEFIF
jgi:hypothetical protein